MRLCKSTEICRDMHKQVYIFIIMQLNTYIRVWISTWCNPSAHFLQLFLCCRAAFTTFYDSAVREYAVVTEWSASLWEQIPAERNAATRERNTFRARFPPGLSPSTAHPPRHEHFWPETSMWTLGWRQKGPRWGRQLAELPNRARWSSLVASQATL